VIIPNVARLALNFDPNKLAADLATLAATDWQAHFNHEVYQGDWSAIALRAASNGHNAIYSDPSATHWADTELLQQCSYFQQILAGFTCPLLSVRLLRLAPGAMIKEHKDSGLGLALGEIRLHIVVSTNPKVECWIDGKSYHWAEGECWYADFGLTHSFINRGDTDRVHIVLDCRVNDWLLMQLNNAAPGIPQLSQTQPSDSVIALLEQMPKALRDELFQYHDRDEFIARFSVYLASINQHLAVQELTDIMRKHQREWLEKDIL